MHALNRELKDHGELVGAEGLSPPGLARVVRATSHGKPSVTDGPFAETKELIAGYWMIRVNSKEEAIEWAKRVPFDRLPSDGRTAEIELRQVFELSDFPDVPADVARLEATFGSGPHK
jgi:hypothetical protein